MRPSLALSLSMTAAVLLLCVIPFRVLAEDIPLTTEGNIDYRNPASYKVERFYRVSDPCEWAYPYVQWDMVDFKREEIYECQRFFQSLPESQYCKLEYQGHQKMYGTGFIDHKKVCVEKFLKDAKSGCELSFQGKGKEFAGYDGWSVVYLGKAPYDPESGPMGDVSFGFKFAPIDAQLCKVVDDGQSVPVLLLEKGTLDATSTTFCPNVMEGGCGIDVEGKEFGIAVDRKTNAGNDEERERVTFGPASGEVRLLAEGFTQTVAYIVDRPTVVTGVNVTLKSKDRYLGAIRYPGRSSLEMAKGRLNISGYAPYQVTMDFLPGNDVVPLRKEKKEHLTMQAMNTSLGLKMVDGRAVITVKDNVGAMVKIFTGDMVIIIRPDRYPRVAVAKQDVTDGKEKGTVPMSITITDGKRTIPIAKDSDRPQEAIVDDGRVVIRDTATTGGEEPSEVNATEEKDAAYTESAYKYQLIKRYGKGTPYGINFPDIDGWKDDEAKVIKEQFDRIALFNDAIIKDIHTLRIHDGLAVAAEARSALVVGYASPENGGYLVLNRDYLFSEDGTEINKAELYGTIVHEATHRHHQEMEKKEPYKFNTFFEGIAKATDDGDAAKGLSMYWQSYCTKENCDNKYRLEEGGWVRLYGSVTKYEDVATMVEAVAKEQLPANLNAHYKGKLSLLCEYGFLAKENRWCGGGLP